MENALWITLVGMGMVFLVILFLWGLMALLVRLTGERTEERALQSERALPSERAVQSERAPVAQPLAGPQAVPGRDRKRKAAAVAVAMALAQRQRAAAPPPPETISPWLAVHRAGLFARQANPRAGGKQ